MKVAVQLVAWNGAPHLPRLFDSLRKQVFKDWLLLVWDNGSSDESVEIIERELENIPNESKLFLETANQGFARSHDLLFKSSDCEYVLLLNQDVILEPDTLQKMVAYLDEHPQAASVAPRMMRLNGGVETDVVDSLGLKILRNRQVMDIFSGSQVPDFAGNQSLPVFGVSAALAMYRRSAVGQTLFDEKYFSYQEDIDLAWRLQLQGFSAAVLTDAVAWHARGQREPDKKTVVAAARSKSQQSYLVRYHSYKNHLATIFKNEQGRNFALDWPWILWYEVGKLGYFLVFDRKVIGGLVELWKNRKLLAAERKSRLTNAVSSRELRKWL